MIDVIINGESYRLVKNKAMFNCYNVLFYGFCYYNNRRYKKYINCEGRFYLVED